MFDFGEEIMIAEQGFLPLGRADMEARGWGMGDFVYVEQADEVILYVTSETDFGGNSQYRENCLQRLDRAEAA